MITRSNRVHRREVLTVLLVEGEVESLQKMANKITTPVTNLVFKAASDVGKFPVSVKQEPVGGRLEFYARNWEALGVDQHILDIIRDGYIIEFAGKPPLTSSPPQGWLPKSEEEVQAIDTLVEEFLQKNIIEEVRNVNSPGYYSKFKVVPKKSGKWRGILDLS